MSKKPVCAALMLIYGINIIHPAFAREGRREAAPTALSHGQEDEVIALDLIQRNPEAAYRAAAIGMAVHYERNRYTGIPDPKELNRVGAFTDGNPFSASTYRAILNPSFDTPKTLEETLTKTAQQLYESTGKPDFRGSALNRAVDLGTSAGVLVAPALVSPPSAIAIGGGKLLFDYMKDLSFDEASTPATFLLPSNGETVRTLARMQGEIRAGSAEGKAYGSYYKSLLRDDPSMPSGQKSPVLAAKLQLAAIRADGQAEQVLIKEGKIASTLDEMNTGIEGLRKQVTEQYSGIMARDSQERQQAVDAEAKKARDEKRVEIVRQNKETAYNLQNAAGGLMLTGYLMEIVGDKDAARFAMGTADAVNKVSNLVSQAADMSPMMLAAGYVGVAMTVFSLLQSSNQPASPFPAIFDMLKQISKQISDLRADLMSTLGKMDNRLGNLLLANIELTDSVKRDTEAMRVQLGQIQAQLQDAQDSLTAQSAALEDLFMSAEDRACMRIENRRLLEPKPDFLACQETYLHRATVVASDAISNATTSDDSAAFGPERQGPFPFANRYRVLQSDLGLRSLPVANPSIWHGSVSRYLLLTRSFPQYIGQIDLSSQGQPPESSTLDPMIRTGESIRDFIHSVAFTGNDTPDGAKLNTASFETLIGGIQRNYQSVLAQLSKDIGRSGVDADVTRSSTAQEADPGYALHFLSGSGIGFCPTERYRVITAKSVSATGPGGHGGWYSETPEDSSGHLADQLDSIMSSTPTTGYQPGRAIVPLIKSPIRLLEILHPDSPLTACFYWISLRDIEMSMARGMQADVAVRIEISANLGAGPVVVQILQGMRHVVSPYFAFFGSGTPRPTSLAGDFAKQLEGHYAEFLKDTDDEIDIKMITPNQKALIEKVNAFLADKRSDLRKSETYQKESDEVERLRTDLVMLAAIGMNVQNAKVDKLVRRIRSEERFPSIPRLIDRVITQGVAPTDESNLLQRRFDELRGSLAKLASLPASELMASTALLDSKITELKVLKDLRVRQAGHGASKKKSESAVVGRPRASATR